MIYECQEVRHPIEGKVAVMEYLKGRWEFIRSLDTAKRDTGHLYPGEVGPPQACDYPCGIFEQGGKRMGLYVIDPSDQGLIKRIDILTVAPRPSEARKLSENWLGQD